jgi:hypothetical protein
VRPIHTEVLAAALELYSNRLMSDTRALDYLQGRGFGRALLERERIGLSQAANSSRISRGAGSHGNELAAPVCSMSTGVR